MAFNNRGVLHRLKNQPDRALLDYDQAIRIDPRPAGALNNRCALRAIVGQLQAAVADCDELFATGYVPMSPMRWPVAGLPI